MSLQVEMITSEHIGLNKRRIINVAHNLLLFEDAGL
jgi:hypothetical protein